MAQFSSTPSLSPRYQLALFKAFEWHCLGEKGFQIRKDNSPYIAHPIAVSALVLENGGNEDEAISALLHDVVEDVGISSEMIAFHFGQAVADIVLELSEPKGGMEWRDRKLAYIQQIREGSQSAVLVSLADKTHNTLAYLKGARIKAKDGSQSKTEQTLWFLDQLANVYREHLPDCYLVQLLERSLAELKILWSGDTAHLVDGKFFSNACDWEREFSEPDYPEEDCYPDNFSRPYWIAVRDKHFWFNTPTSDQQPIESDQTVELLDDINIRYYESGDVSANVPVRLDGRELVIETWGKSAEWLSCYAREGTRVVVNILRRDVVKGVSVAQVQIKEVLISGV